MRRVNPALLAALLVCGCRSRLVPPRHDAGAIADMAAGGFDLGMGDLGLAWRQAHTDVPGCAVSAIAHADFNGDGHDDLALACGGMTMTNAGIVVLSGRGDGTYTIADSNLGGVTDFERIVATDVNRDGRPDLLASTSGRQAVAELVNGAGALPGWSSAVYTLDGSPSGIAAADLDGDGSPDFAAAVLGPNGARLEWAANDGTGGFGLPSILMLQESSLGRLQAGDFDGDGRLDLAVGTGQDHITIVSRGGDGGTGLTPLTQVSIPQGAARCDVLDAGDIDGDGVPDLLVSGSAGSGLWYVADHAGFVAHRVGSPMAMNDGVIGDVDGDGRPDALIIDGNDASVFIRAANGTFGGELLVGSVPLASAVALADENGDRSNDVIVGSNGAVDVFLRTGP